MAARRRFLAVLGVALVGSLAASVNTLQAQVGNNPSRNVPAPATKPGPLGATSSPERFLVTSSANERGTFLWVIDAVEHTVMLCEKAAGAAEFACNKKPLP
jgi:hypothetical protein